MDFQVVQILKGEEGSELGIGSYGAVYKARCDEVLLCAAKVLHPALFQNDDPTASTILRRFRQECDFLKGIKHPNIVQFLGVYDDPHFKQPVLLMELVDDNLTNFLEKSQTPLPLHTQVSFTHDIALALAHLHSKQIVHRDLSSNNVLLVAGSRAKVTDFGMSKLLGPNTTLRTAARRHNLTFCPGTEVYMPPEALTEPPEYTDKLDCFSLGPLMIQIITRRFPKPGPRTERIDDHISPTGTAERPVLETVRRESHLRLINASHPLRNMIKNCLSFNQNDRPSAIELCHQLEEIKKDADSSLPAQECNTIQWEHGPKAPFEISTGSITAHGSTIYVQTWGSTKVYSFETTQSFWTELKDCQKMGTSLVVVDELLTAVGGYFGTEEFDTLTSLNTDGEPEWIEKLPRMPTKRYNASSIRSNNLVIVTGGLSDTCSPNNVEILDTESNPNLWFIATNLPVALSRHSTALCGNRMYLLSGPGAQQISDIIYCELDTLLLHSVPASEHVTESSDSEAPSRWHTSSTLPVYKSTVCTAGGMLLAIGGVDPACRDTDTQNVFQYRPSTDTWTMCTEMPSARSSCLASVVEGNKLVILGGRSDSVMYGSI